MPGDTFDFSGYEAWLVSHEVAAVRLHISAPSEHVGVSISYRQELITSPRISEEPVGNDGAEFGSLTGPQRHFSPRAANIRLVAANIRLV